MHSSNLLQQSSCSGIYEMASRIPDLEKRLSYEHGGLAKLASSLLFDGVIWKEDARNWQSLHGYEKNLAEFALCVCTAPRAFKSLVRLLGGIGTFLLPNGLLWIDTVLNRGDARELLGGRNELFNLACILSFYIFGRTSLLREDYNLRDAVLRILDAMVNQGASAAYRMRDFLISPMPERLNNAD